MTTPVVSRTCHYAGLLTIPFETFTTSYPFIETGWQFSNSSYDPIEFEGYSKNNLPLAIKGNIISTKHYTPFSIGSSNGADNHNAFGDGTYDGNTLFGFAFGVGLAKRFYIYSYGLPNDGVGINNNRMEFFSSILLPGTNNTGAPRPFFGSNILALNGQYTSAENNLNTWSYKVGAGGFLFSTTTPPDYGLSNLLTASNGLYANEQSYMSCSNPSDLTDNTLLIETDYATYAQQVKVTWINPPGNADINTLMVQTAHDLGNTSASGWLQVFKDSVTIEGQSLNGFIVVTAPDCSYYWIIQLLPRDSNAANWTSQIGAYRAKIDSSKALWLKPFNQDATLYVSVGSVIKQLPIYPPIPLPSLYDTDKAVLTMRGM